MAGLSLAGGEELVILAVRCNSAFTPARRAAAPRCAAAALNAYCRSICFPCASATPLCQRTAASPPHPLTLTCSTLAPARAAGTRVLARWRVEKRLKEDVFFKTNAVLGEQTRAVAAAAAASFYARCGDFVWRFSALRGVRPALCRLEDGRALVAGRGARYAAHATAYYPPALRSGAAALQDAKFLRAGASYRVHEHRYKRDFAYHRAFSGRYRQTRLALRWYGI